MTKSKKTPASPPEAAQVPPSAGGETPITGPTKKEKQVSIPSLVTGRHPELRQDEGKPFVGVSTASYPRTHVGQRDPSKVEVTRSTDEEPEPLTRDTPIEVNMREMHAASSGIALDALMARDERGAAPGEPPALPMRVIEPPNEDNTLAWRNAVKAKGHNPDEVAAERENVNEQARIMPGAERFPDMPEDPDEGLLLDDVVPSIQRGEAKEGQRVTEASRQVPLNPKDLFTPCAPAATPQEPAPAPIPSTSETEGEAPVLCFVIPAGATASISVLVGGITITAGRRSV